MITPAVLILAAGNLVMSTYTRLVRISDRARALMAALDVARAKGDSPVIALYTELLGDYRQRSKLVERALASYYLTIGVLVMASLAIAIDRLTGGRAPWLPVSLTVLGAAVLLVGTFSLLQETRISAGSLRKEIDLHEGRRHTDE
jgi:hypothetical protein